MPELPLLHPTGVQLQADLHATIFISETGLTLEEATGQVEAEIPVAPVLTPFQHGKPFVTEEEETARYIKEQLKPKVPPPSEKVPLELGKKLLANLDNPPKPKSLPSDYDRTLTKAHKVRNQKKYGKTIPQLGTQRKELEPLRVPMLPVLHETDLHAAQFHAEIGLMLE